MSSGGFAEANKIGGKTFAFDKQQKTGDETTKEYWDKIIHDDPWAEEDLKKAEKSILDAFPEEIKFEDVVVQRIPNLMELHDKGLQIMYFDVV